MKKYLIILVVLLGRQMQVLSQNIGINDNGATPHPSAMLDVSATNKGMLVPRMKTAQRTAIASPATGLLVYDTDSNGFWFYNGTLWTDLSSAVSAGGFWTSNGTHIFNSNTGNVGIGTNNPTARLTLKTPINTTGFTHIGGADSIIVIEAVGGVSAAMGTSTQHAFRLIAGTLGRVQIYPGGEVVIGSNTTGSFGKFTVETLNNSYGISHIGEGGNILATRMGGTSAGIGTFSNTNMRIFSNSFSAIFIASATGNVGIGTDNPTYKLSVNGNIRSKEVVVETGWADYVFDNKYKLAPLKEVAQFIRQNNHLPNIPSAKEIESNGLHVGETQRKMMEKIEELTLYLIQQQKEIEALKKAILKNK